MPDILEMSPTEYARHRGVTPPAISRMLRAGKIPFRQVGSKKLIDAAAADRALGETQERVDVPDDDAAAASSGAGGFAGAEPSGLTRAKTATEVYNARIRQLEFEERIGKLLPVEGVMRAMEKCAAAIVRDLDQLPNFAEDLATAFTAGGIPAVRARLKEIARGTRIVLAETMRVTAAPAEPKADHRS